MTTDARRRAGDGGSGSRQETGGRPQVRTSHWSGSCPPGQGAAHLSESAPRGRCRAGTGRNAENKSSRCRGDTEVTEDSDFPLGWGSGENQ